MFLVWVVSTRLVNCIRATKKSIDLSLGLNYLEIHFTFTKRFFVTHDFFWVWSRKIFNYRLENYGQRTAIFI